LQFLILNRITMNPSHRHYDYCDYDPNDVYPVDQQVIITIYFPHHKEVYKGADRVNFLS